MSDTTTEPVTVGASALPSLLTTLLRYVAGPIGGFLVGKGWIMADQVPQVAGVLLSIGAAGWGLYQTWRSHSKLLTVAQDPRVPASVATVK